MATSTVAVPRRSAALTRARSWSRNLTPFSVVTATVATMMALLVVYPLLRVASGLFIIDGTVNLQGLRDTLALPGLAQVIVNTFILVLASGTTALIVGSVLAWLNERTDARIKVVTDVLPLVSFLLPPVAGAVGWVLLLSPRAGLLNAAIRTALGWVGVEMVEGPFDIMSWYGLIFVFTIYMVPYVFLMVSAGLRNMDPALEEQSRVSGAGLFTTVRRVTLPGVRPSLGAATLLMLWTGFGLFSVPSIIGTGAGIEVLSVRIAFLLKFDYPPRTEEAIGLSMFVLLIVGTAWYLQRKVLRNARHATISGKGHRTTPIKLGPWRWLAWVGIASYILVAAILPIGGLLLVALNGFWTPNIAWGDLDLDLVWGTVFDDPYSRKALVNSLRLGVFGGLIGIVIAASISLFVVQSPRSGRWIDGTIKAPAAISNIVLAVGFVLAFAGPPFNLSGTVIILLLAYLALYMPQASVASDAAAGQVGKELSEASFVSGAEGGRTFRRVYLPLMLPGLVAGWALLFIRMVGDLTASAILSGPGNPVVGFRILDEYLFGSYGSLAALALTLTLITSTVLVVVMALSRRLQKWTR